MFVLVRGIEAEIRKGRGRRLLHGERRNHRRGPDFSLVRGRTQAGRRHEQERRCNRSRTNKCKHFK
jgi:hypothetical protein